MTLDDGILSQLLQDLPSALLALLIPTVLLSLSVYTCLKKWSTTSILLSISTLLGFWTSPYLVPVRCAALRGLLNFGVATATMKLLDIQVRSLTSSLPLYTAGPQPRPFVMAFILLTELRYESFTPNPIRHPPTPSFPFPGSLDQRHRFYSSPIQLLIHIVAFFIIQLCPQWNTIKALGILHAIWIIWTSMHLLLRYRTSPPLFGPIYLADSLAGFWTETWHNAFTSPCLSLAYTPTLYILTHPKNPICIPRTVARGVAVVAGFALMAGFHVYALGPLLSYEGKKRVAVFFVGNGVATVGESMVWGRGKDWVRTVVAWVVELGLASWTLGGLGVGDGVRGDWRALCWGPGA